MDVSAGEIYDELLDIADSYEVSCYFDSFDKMFEFMSFCIYELGVDPDRKYTVVEVNDIKRLIETSGYLPILFKSDSEVVCETS